jgi:hypothetical protein
MPIGSDADGAPSGIPEGRAATEFGAKGSAIAAGTLPVVIRSPGRGVGHGRVTAGRFDSETFGRKALPARKDSPNTLGVEP